MSDHFVGSTTHRMFADWSLWLQEPTHIWTTEWRTLAVRALSLVCNDPLAQAMVAAKIRETHGPSGMVMRSLYAETGGNSTTGNERDMRLAIERSIRKASAGCFLDAQGLRTRREIEKDLDWTATVMGDAWAVRTWRPDRAGSYQASCWQLVRPERICNPDGKSNDEYLRDGIVLDKNGTAIAIWVLDGEQNTYISWVNVTPYTASPTLSNPTWRRVELRGPDGTPNVIHRVGFRLPGMLRGVSMFSPAILILRQIQGVIEAHVAGKRAQACNPIVYMTDDPNELSTALQTNAALGSNAVIGPLSVLVCKYTGADVKFMNVQFQGSDLRDFLTVMYRNLCAMWGLPWQVVLCEMGDASLASARAGLDQADRTCQTFQEDHISQCTSVIDEVILREEAVRGRLTFFTDDWAEITAGRYIRPPKYSTDRLKDAETLLKLREAGVSPTTAFSLFGLDYEDETEQDARDREFATAQGVGPKEEEPKEEEVDDEQTA